MKLNTKLAMSQQDETQDTWLRWNALVTHEGGPNMPKRWSWGFPAVAVDHPWPFCQGWFLSDLTLGIYPEKWCPSAGFHFIHKILPLGGPSHSKDFWWHDQKNHSREKWITLDNPCVSHLGFRGHGCVCNYIIYLYLYLLFIFIYVYKMYTCEYQIYSTHPRSQL